MEQLGKAIRGVLNGELWFPRSHLSKSIQHYQQTGFSSCRLSDFVNQQTDLTPKERAICLLVIKGMSNRQIANQHNISINTVKCHVSNLMSKLEVSSRQELMGLVLDQKI